MAGISFDGEVRKVNPVWFLQQLEEVINLGSESDVQKKALFKSALRGTASQWIRLLDVPTYREIPDCFKAKYWSVEIQRQVITALQSES